MRAAARLTWLAWVLLSGACTVEHRLVMGDRKSPDVSFPAGFQCLRQNPDNSVSNTLLIERALTNPRNPKTLSLKLVSDLISVSGATVGLGLQNTCRDVDEQGRPNCVVLPQYRASTTVVGVQVNEKTTSPPGITMADGSTINDVPAVKNDFDVLHGLQPPEGSVLIRVVALAETSIEDALAQDEAGQGDFYAGGATGVVGCVMSPLVNLYDATLSTIVLSLSATAGTCNECDVRACASLFQAANTCK